MLWGFPIIFWVIWFMFGILMVYVLRLEKRLFRYTDAVYATLKQEIKDVEQQVTANADKAHAAIGARLDGIANDVQTLKVQGDRNEVAIGRVDDRLNGLETDMKWLKRSQGWQEK